MPKQPTIKPKTKNLAVACKTFTGKSGITYLVFRGAKEAHVFTEVSSRRAAIDCGATQKRGVHAVNRWKEIWDK